MEKTLDKLKSFYADHGVGIPEAHVVLGSVMSKVVDYKHDFEGWTFKGHLNFSEIPGIDQSTAPGHKNMFALYSHSGTGKSIVLQIGRLHGYDGLAARDAVKPIMFHRHIGVKKFFLTNAAGSLQKEIKPCTLMLIRDHVNMSGQNPLTGPNPLDVHGKPIGPRFPDLSEVYDKEMGNFLKKHFESKGLPVSEGAYISVPGPSFETPTEVQLYSKWGLHAVGMSTVWEAIALRHSGARTCAFSLITNYACGLQGHEVLDHFEFEKKAEGIALQTVKSLFEFLSQINL